MVVRKLDLILFKGTVLSVIVLSVIKCSWVKVILICGLLRKEKYIFVSFKNLFLKYLIWLRKKNNLYYLNFTSFFSQPFSISYCLKCIHNYIFCIYYIYMHMYCIYIANIHVYLYIYCKSIFLHILQWYTALEMNVFPLTEPSHVVSNNSYVTVNVLFHFSKC